MCSGPSALPTGAPQSAGLAPTRSLFPPAGSLHTTALLTCAAAPRARGGVPWHPHSTRPGGRGRALSGLPHGGACLPSPDSITGPHTHQECVCCDLRDPTKGSDSCGNACPRHPLGEHLPRARRGGRDRGPAGSVVGRPSLPLAFRQQGGQTHNKTHVHTLPQILGSTGQKTTQGEAGVPGGRFYAEEQTPPPPGRGHST